MLVETFDGYVNLADVVRAKRHPAGGSVLTLRDGSTFTTTTPPDELATASAPVVASSAGAEAVLVWVAPSDGGGRPDMHDVLVGRAAVVAWRVRGGGERGGYADPIMAEEPARNMVVLLPQPGGTLRDAHNTTYPDLDAAKAGILGAEQRRFDAERAHEGLV
jgi:hypothetical protein